MKHRALFTAPDGRILVGAMAKVIYVCTLYCIWLHVYNYTHCVK